MLRTYISNCPFTIILLPVLFAYQIINFNISNIILVFNSIPFGEAKTQHFAHHSIDKLKVATHRIRVLLYSICYRP